MLSTSKTFAILLTLVLIANSVEFFPQIIEDHIDSNPPKTVDYVDTKRYVGRWYQQALIPVVFERNCVDSQSFYTLIDEKTIKIQNSCVKDGKRSSSFGKGLIENESHSKLKVIFNPLMKYGKGQYWIVKLGDAYNYGYSVVSTPDYKMLWILSRDYFMDDETYNSIINWLWEQGGYKVDKIVRSKR